VILVDTNVLVALADPRDGLNARAVADLRRLVGRPMTLTQGALAEAFALVSGRAARARLRAVIESLDLHPCTVEADRDFWLEAFAWLDRYAEHDPDWTDAVLAVLAGRFKKWKVWTYDREFTTLWRSPRGSVISLAVTNYGN
jgi:predicted nucleic acid-binding protein